MEGLYFDYTLMGNPSMTQFLMLQGLIGWISDLQQIPLLLSP